MCSRLAYPSAVELDLERPLLTPTLHPGRGHHGGLQVASQRVAPWATATSPRSRPRLSIVWTKLPPLPELAARPYRPEVRTIKCRLQRLRTKNSPAALEAPYAFTGFGAEPST